MWVLKAAEGRLFDPEEWDALADPAPLPVSDLAIGMDVPPSRGAATVCLAGRRADGRISCEWYATAPGATWLPAWVDSHLTEAVRAVVVDERGALAELDWAAAIVRPTAADARDVARGAGLFWDAVTEGTLRHRAQVELTKAVLNAKQRPMMGGQAFGWDRRAPGSSVLIAATLALWGVTGCDKPTRPRRPTSPRSIVVLN